MIMLQLPPCKNGCVQKAHIEKINSMNERAAMKKNAGERNVVNYIRRCMESQAPLDITVIANSVSVSVNKLRKIIRENMTDEPRADELLAQLPSNRRKEKIERSLKHQAGE